MEIEGSRRVGREIEHLRMVMRKCCEAIRDQDVLGALRMLEVALASPEYIVQWSDDGGETWSDGGPARWSVSGWEMSGLPAGRMVILRVVSR